MTIETGIKLFFFLYVLFLLFGAPWLADKQAKQNVAKWEREGKL